MPGRNRTDLARPSSRHSPAIKTILAGALAVSLAGCQTQTISQNVLGSKYNLFYTQADHITELLDQDKPLEASKVYNDEQRFFIGKGGKHANLLRRLRTEVEAHFRVVNDPLIDELSATNWPAPPSMWPEVRGRIARADGMHDVTESHNILTWNGRSPVATRLKAAIDDLRDRLNSTAAQQFLAYGPITEPAFEDVYPVDVDTADLLADNGDRIEALVAGYDQDQLLALQQRYRGDLPGTIADDVAERYVVRATDVGTTQNGNWLQARLQALQQAKTHGMTVPEALAARIRVIDISSRTLVRAKQFDFPVGLQSELPASMEEAALDDALDGDGAGEADAVILIDIAAARTDRDISNYKPVSSERQIGTRTVANPAYSGAQNAVTQAQMGLQNAKMGEMQIDNQFCQGLGCIAKAVAQIAAAVEVSNAEEALTGAMATLQSTPMMIDQPVFGAYRFRRADVRARKTAVVNYYVIDHTAKRMFKDTFDAVETRDFTVPYGLVQEDRHLDRHLKDVDSESDVDDFETQAMTVEVGELLEQFFANAAAAKPLPTMKALRTAIIADKNKVLARFEQDRVKEVDHTEFDDLAESVVAVYNNVKSSIGTGFYVTDDLVVTNQHVTDGARFVELKLRNGLESFGKVIAEDVRRDLALIKVEARGAPVGFFAGDALPIGATVIAIGHPHGLEFSVSRGVISSVREITSDKVGGKPVWHIQTDAAINGGNSGGPLFLSGEVVGVNTKGYRSSVATGLNFSVLYKEVVEFLKSHDVKVRFGQTKIKAAGKGSS